jgi:hypothetical protein
MSMCFVSNTSKPRTQPVVTQPVVTQPAVTQPAVTQPLTTQSTSSIITRTRARPNTSRFNMNDTFAARGRPCPRS